MLTLLTLLTDKQEVSIIQFTPHEYQTYAIDRIVKPDHNGRREVALFLEPGLGKTVITLTAINELMFNQFEIKKVLVIAPLRVAEDTWAREADKWDHLKHLRISKVLGTEAKRKKALEADADIYVINRENVEWLERQETEGFDMLVIDELSSFKSHTTKRFKALCKWMWRLKIRHRVGLTGTPTPNGLVDLWSQMFLVDGGTSLFTEHKQFMEAYFRPKRSIERNGKTIVIEWETIKWTYPSGNKYNAEDDIRRRMRNNSISMRAQDWLKLPARIDRIVPVTLAEKARILYEQMETQLAIELSDRTIKANDSMTVQNKLLQLCNGAVYNDETTYTEIHAAKLDVLEELMEAANGHPVLVFYSYRHDLERMMKRFKAFGTRHLQHASDIRDWNDGNIPMMLAHPASAGHGLNLQAGGHIIVWFGLPWSLELYEQANARLHRQGQEQAVIVHHLIAEDTIDETVLYALKHKSNVQEALMDALKAKIGRKEETA